MGKLYLLIAFFAFSTTFAFAQTDTTITKKDKAVLDSMMAADDFLHLFEDSAQSYFDISIGFGNGTFSTQNQAVNATGYTNQLVLTPAVFYFFKSGINIGVTGFLTNENSNLSLYQTGASVGYDYKDKKIATGISYTRYFGDKDKYNGKSIYQNEAYAYLKYTKPYIEPGISFGFANGNYKAIDVASFKRLVHFPLPLPNGRDSVITFTGLDSTNNKTSYFSVTLSAEHTFEFENIFTKNDGLTIEPIIMLNAGSDKVNSTHTNKIFNNPKVKASRKKTSQTNKMQLQSIASSINFTYGIGKFYLQPNVYFDYYLPQTSEKRFSSIFSLTAGISF